MVYVKNYETTGTSTLVEVMQKKAVASFFRTRCTFISLKTGFLNLY